MAPKNPKFTLPVTHAPAPGSAKAEVRKTEEQTNPPELEAVGLQKNTVTGEVTEKPVKKTKPTPTKADDQSFEDKVAQAVAKSLASVMPTLATSIATAMAQGQMAVEAVKQQTEHDKLMAAAKKKLAKEEKCSVCRQVVGDGKTHGCGGPYRRDKKGNYVMEPVLNPDGTNVLDADDKPMMKRIEDIAQFHVKMVVFPSDPLAAEWFPYCKVNGVEYFSAGPNHEIWVPKQNDIASQIAIYEQNEREQRVGRKHVRKFGGSTGAPAPLGVGFN